MGSAAEDQERTEAIRALWSDGDYDTIAKLFEPVSQRVVAELDLAGRQVLDAATGTGNTALAAARAGARVSAFDLTPELLAIARRRCEQAGLEVSLREGDLLAMPYEDDSFDVVISTFGAFTADDPAACAAELVRVCRPGGLIVNTAWSDEGVLAVMTNTVARHHPELFQGGGPLPWRWADQTELDEIFAGLSCRLELSQHWHAMVFASTAEAWEIMARTSGPVQRLEAAVSAAGGDWEAIAAEIVAGWEPYASPDDGGGVSLRSRYGLLRAEVLAAPENGSQ